MFIDVSTYLSIMYLFGGPARAQQCLALQSSVHEESIVHQGGAAASGAPLVPKLPTATGCDEYNTVDIVPEEKESADPVDVWERISRNSFSLPCTDLPL